MACLHLMRDELDCAIYVDTGFSYPETLALIDYAETILPVHRVFSGRNAQNAVMGIPADVVPINWTVLGQQLTGQKAVTVQSYLGCCFENVTQPLIQKAKEIGVTQLVSGQRSDESHKSTFRNGMVIDGIERLNPIESWSTGEVIEYLKTKMTVPNHFAIKHSSLDCYDCTAYAGDSNDRVEWTKQQHPAFHAKYMIRRNGLDNALMTAQG